MSIHLQRVHDIGALRLCGNGSRGVSRVSAAAVEFAKIGGVQSQGYAHTGFACGFCDFKTGLIGRDDQCAIANLLTSPVFDDMFHPKTAELWGVCDGCPAEPLSAKINLLLGDPCVHIINGVGGHNSQRTDLQFLLFVRGDGVAHDAIWCQGCEMRSLVCPWSNELAGNLGGTSMRRDAG